MSTSPRSPGAPGSELDLAGRRALVSGGTRGIGAATANLLSARGAHVLVVARTESERATAHGAAWTLDGVPIPYATRFGPDPGGDPSCVIPVERIAGRMLVVGAGSDAVWPSGEMAQAIATRRAAHGHTEDVLVVNPDAGHHFERRRMSTATPTTSHHAGYGTHLACFLATLSGASS